jgi:hypothetical protein
MRLAKVFAIFSITGLLSVTAGAAHANSYDSSSGYTPSGDTNQNLNVSTNNNSKSTSNAQGNLNQAGSLVNTQVNNYALGRSIVGNGIADCSSMVLLLVPMEQVMDRLILAVLGARLPIRIPLG